MGTVFYGDKGVVLRTVADAPFDPDQIPDEDVLVLRRVVIQMLKDAGKTNPQIRALFAAAKRAVD